MKTIAFFIRHFSERGTEVSIYNYANYNETVLKNRSIIVGFKKEVYQRIGVPCIDEVLNKFRKRFPVFLVDQFSEIELLLKQGNVDLFYTQTHGSIGGEMFPYGQIQNTPGFIHSVFTTAEPHGTYYSPISNDLNRRFGTSFPVLPLIISIDDTTETLRETLSIPTNAKVFGRHGGEDTFDIQFVKDVIRTIVQKDKNVYFLFMNTNVFCEHPQVIFLPRSIDEVYKRKFINTCDAFIHARAQGETYGMAIAEFAVCGKPIVTYGKSPEVAHIENLGDSAILYNDYDDLYRKIQSFVPNTIDMTNIGYLKFTPENVMKTFMEILQTNRQWTP